MDIYECSQQFYKQAVTQKRIIGKSSFGRDIYAVKIGNGKPVGIAQYAIHAREFITAQLAFHHYRRGVERGSVWLIPLANPDGCLLSQIGLQSVQDEKTKQHLLFLNHGNEDFSLWKANGRGVDLNVNFDADWGKGSKNTRLKGAENCIGETPFSEKESVALMKFTLEIRPDFTLSYHTKGEEIYWYYHQPIRAVARDKELALALSKSTGYPLKFAKGSAGGYKDWCIKRLGISAFTIEAGNDGLSHPIRQENFTDILSKNENVLCDLSNAYFQMQRRN